ncbi:MAG: DUF2804 domain-containing protein [Sphaerochaetaceae bacterium]|nr:DUF2804 domain-containing protein [Sphaerochaetaceae bacterium]MDD4219678.1 DUF2804 domain-containing protein [Sphaerochaetaceae bacterium]
MMQHEVTEKQNLLDAQGKIIEEGWARRPVWRYDRKHVRASALRIKEWDYYSIMSHKHSFSLCVTFSDLGFSGLFAIAYIDLATGKVAQKDAIKLLSMGKLGLSPHSGDHAVAWANKKMRIALSRKEERRRILIGAPDLVLPDGRIGLDADLTLVQIPTTESLNIATSWKEKRTAFYLNEKINCLATSGTVRLGNESITLKPNETFSVLDWGRGRWTYVNRWFWASASGMLDNHSFGFNLGYGFSDRSAASENAIFYDHKIHKIAEITFNIPESGYTEPWVITSSDNRFEMTFKPVVDRQTKTNLLLIKSDQHQVFGYFNGIAVLDDGTKLVVENFPGFAEDVFNRF